jgi:N6-adenosine-specific RNA methylase IME4
MRNTFSELEALAATGYRAGVIYADVPLRFDTWSDKGRGRCADQHYPTMTVEELIAMRPLILALAAKDCRLHFWTSGNLLLKSLAIVEGWGFAYSTLGFIWVKTQVGCISTDPDELTDDDLWIATGKTTRASAEMTILAKRGRFDRRDAKVRQAVIAPHGAHSAKPEEVAHRIERLNSGPYLKLFARHQRPNWTCWGDELPPLVIPNLREAAE